MSASRGIRRYATALSMAGALLAAPSALTAPAFAQYNNRGTPGTFVNIRPSLRLTQFNFGLRYPCDREDKSQVFSCSNNLSPAALGGSERKPAGKKLQASKAR